MNVEMIEWFDDHFYKITNETETDYYPSVTTILNAEPKPFLGNWRGQVGNWEANRIMEDAAAKGTRVHTACEYMANGWSVIFDKSHPNTEFTAKKKEHYIHDQQEHLEVYRVQQFFNIVKPKVLSTEIIIYNEEKKYAGTVDLILDIPGGTYEINGSKPMKLEAGRYIADYKTGKAIYDTAPRQLSAYREAYELMTGDKIKGALILHTNASKTKKGISGFKTMLIDDEALKTAYTEFLKVKDVYDISPLYKPKIFSLPRVLKLEVDNDTEQ